jgi:hypothetical protein
VLLHPVFSVCGAVLIGLISRADPFMQSIVENLGPTEDIRIVYTVAAVYLSFLVSAEAAIRR